MRNSLLRDGRLASIFSMLGRAELVADVGCDHGYLSAALITSGKAGRVVASDVSPASCVKARRLAEELMITDRMKVVMGDGLDPIAGEEPPYKIAVCGMGGELILKILEANRPAAERAELIVMQPMKGEAELREYLFRGGFGVTDERVVCDNGRFYQIIAAKYGEPNDIPEGFPKGFYRFGWVMAEKHGEELLPLLRHYYGVYSKELAVARSKGRDPEPIKKELQLTGDLIRFVEGSARCV